MRPSLHAALVLLAACSSDPAPAPGSGAVTKTVGPEGGTIVVEGATVTIPEGALAASTSITISVSEAGPPAEFVALSRLFKCEPSGTDFAKPVTMQMPFTDDGRPSSLFWTSGADPSFRDLGGQASNGMMTATILHFSAGFVGRRKQ
jgi:hypothetical protein